MFRIKTKNKNKISQVPPSTDAQFPLCTATERRWSRKSVDRGSPVSNAILLPTSLTNSRDLGPIAPMVLDQRIVKGSPCIPYLALPVCSTAIDLHHNAPTASSLAVTLIVVLQCWMAVVSLLSWWNHAALK